MSTLVKVRCAITEKLYHHVEIEIDRTEYSKFRNMNDEELASILEEYIDRDNCCSDRDVEISCLEKIND